MKTFQDCIQEHVRISPEKLQRVREGFAEKNLEKGAFFLEPGTPCRELAFICSGYLRMYDLVDGEEVTYWIANGGSFITSVSSFVFGEQNFWYIQAVTDATLWVIERDRHFELLREVPEWMEFDNLLLARAYSVLEKTMFAHLHTTARERFKALMQDQPDIFRNVPLQYIASMLGVAPETLSRLRKELARDFS